MTTAPQATTEPRGTGCERDSRPVGKCKHAGLQRTAISKNHPSSVLSPITNSRRRLLESAQGASSKLRDADNSSVRRCSLQPVAYTAHVRQHCCWAGQRRHNRTATPFRLDKAARRRLVKHAFVARQQIGQDGHAFDVAVESLRRSRGVGPPSGDAGDGRPRVGKLCRTQVTRPILSTSGKKAARPRRPCTPVRATNTRWPRT